jgi:hypothetical protein
VLVPLDRHRRALVCDCLEAAEPSTISLSASICADKPPVSQNFLMCGLILDSDLNARSMSIGYTLSIGTPSAISANSRLGVPAAMSSSMRAPRNFATSQNSTQLFGCLPSGNASLF